MKPKSITIATMLFGLITAEPVLALPPLRPEAETRGTKPPIELILRLYKRRIKPDESLWGQIEIKNVGRKNIFITDDLFFKSWPIDEKSSGSVGVYVEVLDAAGKPARRRLEVFDLEAHPIERPVDPDEGRKIDGLLEGWKKTGLSKEEIDAKLEDYARDNGRIARQKEHASWKTEVAPLGASG